MTILEALQQSINTLNGINVPISLLQQIGAPIMNTVNLLKATVEALENGDQKSEETEATNEESNRQ